MIGDIDENDVDDTEEDIEDVSADNDGDDLLDEDPEPTLAVDNVGDLSVEINVEELVAKIESSDGEEATRRAEVRRKLEDINEQRDSDLDSTYNFNIDEDD